MGALRAASARLIAQAVSVEPVKATPETRGSRVSTRHPQYGTVARKVLQDVDRHAGGVPLGLKRGVADQQGLFGGSEAMTGVPAASAAATWPRKIASGEFHGLDDELEHATAVEEQLVAFAPWGPAAVRAGRTGGAPWWRSNAGNRRLRGSRRWRLAGSCPLRALESAMNSARLCSSCSAACSRIAARLAAGRRSQPGCALTAAASARSTRAGSVFSTVPMMRRRSVGW